MNSEARTIANENVRGMTHRRGMIRGESARRTCNVRRGARVEKPIRGAAGVLLLHGEALESSVQLIVLLPGGPARG